MRTILQEKAIQFAKILGFRDEFQERIDVNWINQFKSRHYNVAEQIHGQSALAPLSQVSLWKETILPGIMQEIQMGKI